MNTAGNIKSRDAVDRADTGGRGDGNARPNLLAVKATDWEAMSIAQVGGAVDFGGGVWWLMFRSRRVGVQEAFYYYGLGIGEGGSAGGASLPSLPSGRMTYTRLVCRRAFSIEDLHDSMGEVGMISASLALGAATIVISAYNFGGALFLNQTLSGFGAGVGVIAIATVGQWRCQRLVMKQISENTGAYLHGR